MDIKTFQDSLPYLFEAQITPFIWGHAGIGKSSLVKQYADANGYHFFPLYLGTQSDLGDVLGLADFVRDEKGTAVATTFATPIWLKETIDYCNGNPQSGAIIFLDEFNRARRDVLQGMFSLALDKTFHTIKLPKNCHIVAAGNPPTDEYQVTDVNETALMARFAHIKLEPTVQEWLEYADKKNYDHTLVSFIQAQPQLLEDVKSDYQLPVKVDRRSYDRIQRLVNVSTPRALLLALMQGILGLERTVAYEKHLSTAEHPLSPVDVLEGTKLDVIKSWTNSETPKTSLLKLTIEKLNKYMKTESLNYNEEQKLFEFLFLIPKELAYVFFRTALADNSASFRAFSTNPKYETKLTKFVREAKGIV